MSAVIEKPARFDAARVAAWWRSASGKNEAPGDRALLARLRHGRTPLEIALTEAFHHARNDLGRMGGDDLTRLACVLGVLAHVKEDAASEWVAASLGGRPQPLMHRLRFQRLLQVEDHDYEALHAHGVRLVRLLKQRANVENLARSLYFWGEDTRLRWAQSYYESIDTQEK